MVDKPKCMTCDTEDGVIGGWCNPCWEIAKKDVLAKYLCSRCGEAMPRKEKGDCPCPLL